MSRNLGTKLIPKVTILIDTYNYGRFIEDAIQSALNQTFPSKDIEIIVVDDGSTDNTHERVKKYKDKIKYIYKENGGQASAFNVGFKNAQGEYIVLLDADDYLLPQRVEKVVNEFEKYKEVVCVLNARRIVLNDKIFKEETFPEFHNLELSEKNVDLFIKSSYGTSRSAFRKSAIEKIFPLPEQSLKIEADLYLNLVAHWIGNLACLNEVLTVYRIHGENLFHLISYDRLPLQIESIMTALGYVREKVSGLSRKDIHLLDKLLLPYEIERKEKEFVLALNKGTVRRRDVLSIEIDKYRLGKSTWSNSYKFYKLITLPVLMILPPRILWNLRKLFWRMGFYKLRKILFKD